MSGEHENPALNLEKCSVILLDVAGTTTSINFVKETLFPYATSKAEEFLKSHWEDEAVKESVKLLKDSELALKDAATAIKELTEQNSENKGLKTIQGLIYKAGYENGDLKAHVFSDVPTSLDAWTKSKKIAIYSTGSVESQKLLFSHTTEGDVSKHITKYFDQGVGSKTESQSYENIAKELATEKGEIVFITDNVQEAKAAKTSGLVTVLVKREGNEPFPEEATKDFPVISSFKDIVFENPAKRKNVDEVVPTEEQPPSKLPKKEVAEENPVAANTPEAGPSEEAGKKEPEVESMEVDGAEEKTEVTVEAESTVKPTEAPIENEKTETDSIEKKTDVSESVDKDKPKEAAMTVDTPMETSDTIDESKDENKVEDKTKEMATDKSKGEKEVEPKATKKTDGPSNDNSKMEKIDSSDINDKDKVEKGPCDTTAAVTDDNKKQMADEKTQKQTDTTEEKVVCDVNQKVNTVEEKVETKGEKTDQHVSQENKETVNGESKVEVGSVSEKKVEKAVQEGKTVEGKLEENKKNTETSDENTTEEKSDEKKEDKEKPLEVDSVAAKDKAKDLGKNECEKKIPEEKVDGVDSPKQEENIVEQEKKDEKDAEKETTTDKESVEEKENKSDLANGVENEKKGPETAVNGDAEEKSCDEKKVDEAKVDEIKVKKVEDASDSTPPVSVEV